MWCLEKCFGVRLPPKTKSILTPVSVLENSVAVLMVSAKGIFNHREGPHALEQEFSNCALKLVTSLTVTKFTDQSVQIYFMNKSF